MLVNFVKEFKLCRFADDLFLKDISKAVNCIKECSDVSRLRMDMDKSVLFPHPDIFFVLFQLKAK